MDEYISVAQAAELAGRSPEWVRERLEPDHPDAIPGVRWHTGKTGTRRVFEIDEAKLREWLAKDKR